MRRLYSLVLLLSSPLILAYFGLRGLRDPRYRQRWTERLGWKAIPPGPYDYLVHAASLGEVNAALPLVNELLAREPGVRILLTSFTPTGSRRIQDLFGERVTHAYLPLDFSGATRRFLQRARPAVIAIVETEIWPNLYFHAQQSGLPLVIVNARMSKPSERGYQRLRRLFAPALQSVNRVLVQGRQDARRFVACGAAPERVREAGNLKFDIRLPASLLETGELLRAGWGVGRPVFVAGSTHEADEAVLLAGFRGVLAKHPNALLVLAPRHPERFDRAAQGVLDAGLSLSRRSDSRLPGDAQCLLVDTMGELLNYYAAADVSFVGGTIAEVGGHNLLEPVALGKPLLFGPHTAHVRETATRLLESGAAQRVLTPGDIEAALKNLFTHPATRDRMGQAGLQLIERGRGALQLTLGVLDELRKPADTKPE
jgi:3-deoxy-D-manno-octulosonic-acid transferase